jgi:hypothetical protein
LILFTACQRLHRSLLPDYPARAAVFWWALVLAGTGAVTWSLWSVWHMPTTQIGQVAIGVLLAAAAAFFPIVMPRTQTAFAGGEVFIFMLLLLYGPAAAVLAAAAEAAVASWRVSRRWSSRIASPALCALSMCIC